MTLTALWGARADAGGLANLTTEAARHLNFDRILLIDLAEKGRGDFHPDRYEGLTPDLRIQRGMDHLITDETIDAFLDGMEGGVVYGAETFYRDGFVERARERGVRTVLAAMPELVRHDLGTPDATWLPTTWEAERVPGAAIVPVPVNRHLFAFRPRTECRTFLHVAAPAFHDRNGTRLLLAALRYVTAPCRVAIRAANARRSLPTINRRAVPRHVELEVVTSTATDYRDVYPADADVLVLPRRYGGLSLPVNESASLGMPVLMLDLPPYNEVLPDEALVPARPLRRARMVGGEFMVHDADPRALAAKMDELCGDAALVERLSKSSDEFAASIGWDVWAPRYRELLAGVA